MTTTTSSPTTVIAIAEPVFTNAERLALAGFLAGYTGLTPRRVRPGPAPVRQLVPAPLSPPVRCPSARH